VQRRRERAWTHRVLDQREAAAGIARVDHEPDADASEEAGLAVLRSQHPRRDRLHARSVPFSGQLCRANIWTLARCVKIHRTAVADQKRRYRMTRRAESEQATRRRITESAVHLHETVGPARTPINAVAEHAGVRRSTVYRHFADEAGLMAACSAHWSALNPPPDLERWAEIEDPEERLRSGLEELYAYYGRTRGMLENLFRDEAISTTVAKTFRPYRAYTAAACEVLMAGRRSRGRTGKRLRAALGHA